MVLNVAASQVVAGHDLNVDVNKLNVTGLADTSSTNMAQTTSSWGFSIGLTGSLGSALNGIGGATQQLTAAANAPNARVSALYGVAAARSIYMSPPAASRLIRATMSARSTRARIRRRSLA